MIVNNNSISREEGPPKIEHPFHVVKNLFGHRKARYKGMARIKLRLGVVGLASRSLLTVDP